MEGKKSKKFIIILCCFVFIAIISMFASFYHMYQMKVIEPTKKEVIINKFQMLLMFNKDNQINGHNIKTGWEETREFTIENFSKDTIGKYNIILEVITPLSNMIDEKFTYTLEGTSASTDTSNRVINIGETPVPVVTKNLGTAVITPKNIETYKIRFSLNKGARNYPKDNIFAIKIKIVNAD